MTDQKSKFTLDSRKKYEITLTFKDKYQYIERNTKIRHDIENGIDFKYDPYSRLKNHQKWFNQTIIPLLKMYSEFKLHIELSDPQVLDDTKWPRIHYHGTIRFKNNESLLLWKLNTAPELSSYGRIQLNPYRPDYWDKYCIKDKSKTHELFRQQKLNTIVIFPSMKKKFFS